MIGAVSITRSITEFWDAAADSFDEPADHGLHDPAVRAAWSDRLDQWLPTAPADVLDLGCGTGSLALLVAQRGHRVTGVDISPNMVEHARRKLAGFDATFMVGDAAEPPEAPVDVVLARHVVWTLPDPAAALERWVSQCHPGGRLVLIEGRWGAGGGYVEGALPWDGGVTASTLSAALRPLVSELVVEPLTDPRLWGRAVDDERYAVLATV